MKNLIALIYLFLLSVLGIFGYLIFHSDTKLEQQATEVDSAYYHAFCGTSSDDFFYSETVNSTIGRATFKEQCNQCHAKDMRSELTGPALGNTFYFRYLSNSKSYCDTTTNQRLLQLKKDFGFLYSHQYNLSYEEIRSVIGYIEDRSY